MAEAAPTPPGKTHADFERYYRNHERARIARGDPSPEALGRLDARKELPQVRELEALAEASAG